jgi:hypothetical protein
VFARFLPEVGQAPLGLRKKYALGSEINDLWIGHAYFSNFSERHPHRVSKAVFHFAPIGATDGCSLNNYKRYWVKFRVKQFEIRLFSSGYHSQIEIFSRIE